MSPIWSIAVLLLAACGRVDFDAVNDGGIGDGADADVVSPDRCPPAPRPTGSPATVIGAGTAESCDQAAIEAALPAGGWIGFDCGAGNLTIVLASELSIVQPTILDGGGRITLSGGGTTRVLNINTPGQVTLLDLVIADGASSASGAGVLIQNGQVTIIGSTLHDNRGPAAHPTAGGGAIGSPPIGGTLAIYDSLLRDNQAANGGAISIWGDLTIVESSLVANRATGTGADTGNGGLGGAIANAGRGSLSLCGVTITDSTAGELGGALHRVCTDSSCTDEIRRTSIVNNAAPSAGGAYHQAAAVTISQSTIANNQATASVGGYWYIGSSTTFFAENITVAGNTCGVGTGAGISVNASSGTISFSTIADNRCVGPTCFSAAIAASTGITLRGTLVANNSITATGVPVSCDTQMLDGANNFQWPVMRPGGGTDDPSALCAPSIRVEDPRVAPVTELAGPAGRFLVAPLDTGSPAQQLVSTMCPAEDQLGHPRQMPCSAGAVEP